MSDTLRILLLEDLPTDIELIRLALRHMSHAQLRVASNEREFRAELDEKPDIVLSDYQLPAFDGLAALALLRERDPSTPFILLSGTVGEETAVLAMRNGATDYLLKDRLTRLAPAIERAMQLRTAEAEKAAAIRDLVQSRADLEIAQERASIGSWELDLASGKVRWSRQMCTLMLHDPVLPVPGIRQLLSRVHPSDRACVLAVFARRTPSTATPARVVFRTHPAKGPVRHLAATIDVPRVAQNRASVGGTVHDITERKAAEDRLLLLNRTLEVMRRVSGLVVRVRSREELFREACAVIGEYGSRAFAWIGLPRDGRLEPVAWAGSHGHAMEGLAAAAAIPAHGAIVVNRLADTGPGQHAVRAAGFGSMVSLPMLERGGKVRAVLSLYSMQEHAFDDDEVRLLRELARDVSLALDHIERAGQLDYLAYYDELTGLANRALFHQRVAQLASSARRQNALAAVVLVDVERFRAINIALGRRGGDEFLRQVAARLRESALADDSVARLGADIFAVAISGIGKAADAAHYLNKLLLPALERPFTIEGREIRVSARSGISVFPDDGADAEALLAGAEAALRSAKKDFARVAFHAPGVNARVSQLLTLETRLRFALDHDQFLLHYQPKVDLVTGEVVGLEALLRWGDPGGGLVAPGAFIPLLEETGLIVEVGRWVMHRAVSDWLESATRGVRLPRIAVNVSPVQVRQREFVATVLEAIARFGAGEAALDLEITESAVMEQVQVVSGQLQSLRQAGARIELDDFGTGYSSLAHLGTLPLDALKIDRSFVVDMESRAYSRDVVAMTCALAQAARLKVVAEGVETVAQAEMLRALGCNQMQGFLHSRPAPLAEIEALLAQGGGPLGRP